MSIKRNVWTRAVTLGAPAQLGRGGLPRPRRFGEVDRGGHFAPWEEPELFSDEMRAAFKSMR
jgi:hypothetical protein